MTRLCLALVWLTLTGCADLTAPSSSSSSSKSPPSDAITVSPAPRAAPPPTDPTAALTKVRASHVLVAYQGSARSSATRSKDDARALAGQLLTRLRGGAIFEATAKDHSDDPSAKTRGGDLGAFDRSTMTKAFADAAFRLDVGQISDVVETEFGFHIIKRTE